MGCNSSLLSLQQKINSERQLIDFSVFIKANTSQVLGVYKFQSWISRSPTAMVRRVVHKTSGIQRVVKIYHRESDNQQKAMNEINALKKLDHPNIIRLYEYFMDQTFIYIILEKVDGSQLFSELLNVDDNLKKNFPIIFKQILSAIEHCHSVGVIHRNITADNILIHKSADEKLIVKLIDFSQVLFMPKSKIEMRQKQRVLRLGKNVTIQDYQLQSQTLKINLNSEEKQEYQIRNGKKAVNSLMIKKTDSFNHKNMQSQQLSNLQKYQDQQSHVRVKPRQVSMINGDRKVKKRMLNSQLYQNNSQMYYQIRNEINQNRTARFSQKNRSVHENQLTRQKSSKFKYQGQYLVKQLKQNIILEKETNSQNIIQEAKLNQQQLKNTLNISNRQVCETPPRQKDQLRVISLNSQACHNLQSEKTAGNGDKVYKNNQTSKHDQNSSKKKTTAKAKACNNLTIEPVRQKRMKSMQKTGIRDNPNQDMYLCSELNKLKTPIKRKINRAFQPPEEPDMQTIQLEDIWYCGIILFTVVTGKHFLAEAKPAKQVVGKLIHSWIRQNKGAQQIGDLMLQMLCLNAQKRPRAYDCLQHKFLKQNTESGSQWRLTMVYKFLHDYKIEHNVKSLFAMYLTRQISTIYEQSEFMLEFSNLDTNNDGRLQYEQLIQGLINSFTIDQESAKKYVEEIFSSLDKNNNRCIEYSEFIMGTMNMTKRIKDDNIKKLFQQIDRNGDGYISQEQLKYIFQGFEDDQQLRKLIAMKRFSKKGINMQEFTTFIKQALVHNKSI